jgi:hypothetical protein
MTEIQYKQTMCISVVADESYSWSSWTISRPFVRGIDTDRYAAVIGCCVPIRVGHRLVYVSESVNKIQLVIDVHHTY